MVPKWSPRVTIFLAPHKPYHLAAGDTSDYQKPSLKLGHANACACARPPHRTVRDAPTTQPERQRRTVARPREHLWSLLQVAKGSAARENTYRPGRTPVSRAMTQHRANNQKTRTDLDGRQNPGRCHTHRAEEIKSRTPTERALRPSLITVHCFSHVLHVLSAPSYPCPVPLE